MSGDYAAALLLATKKFREETSQDIGSPTDVSISYETSSTPRTMMLVSFNPPRTPTVRDGRIHLACNTGTSFAVNLRTEAVTRATPTC